MFQLPGFYYDAEKKKYFRILPSHSNAMSGVVTPEVIDCKQAKLQFEKESSSFVKPVISGQSRTSLKSQNIVHLVTNGAIGRLSSLGLQQLFRSNTIRHLTYQGYEKMSYRDRNRFSHANQLMLSADQTQLVCLWSTVRQTCRSLHNVVQRLDIVDIVKKENNHSLLRTKTTGYQNFAPNHISSMCFTGEQHQPRRPVLYTAAIMSTPMNITSFAVIDPVTKTDINIQCHSYVPTQYAVGNMWTWSCASNCSGTSFVVGTEKRALMFDSETARRLPVDTCNSDVLSVSYANMVSKYLLPFITKISYVLALVSLC